MEPITYGYSKFIGWSGMIFFTGSLVFILYLGILAHDAKAWLYFSIPM